MINLPLSGRKETIQKEIVETIELQTFEEHQVKKVSAKVAKKTAKCLYMRLANEYRGLLGWNPNLFHVSQVKSYCTDCYPAEKPDVMIVAKK